MVLVKTSFSAFSLVDEKRVTFTAKRQSFFLFQKFCSLSVIRNTESMVYLSTKAGYIPASQ